MPFKLNLTRTRVFAIALSSIAISIRWTQCYRLSSKDHVHTSINLAIGFGQPIYNVLERDRTGTTRTTHYDTIMSPL